MAVSHTRELFARTFRAVDLARVFTLTRTRMFARIIRLSVKRPYKDKSPGMFTFAVFTLDTSGKGTHNEYLLPM